MIRTGVVFAAGFLCGAAVIWLNLADRNTLTQAAAPQTARILCTVSFVMDGDSLQCSENGTRVRLLLIDSPERGQTEFHDSARDFLARLLPRGSKAMLEIDVEPQDRFGRILAYVWLPDGRMANEEMVRAGLALAFPYKGVNVRHLSRINAAQLHAEKERAGFWQKGEITCTPQQFRHKKCTGFQ